MTHINVRAVIDGWFAFRSRDAHQCHMDFLTCDAVGELEIDSFEVEPPARHRGHGARAMAEICRLADLHRVTLALQPVPNAEAGETMGFDCLAEFYARFGFCWADAMMVRRPAAIAV